MLVWNPQNIVFILYYFLVSIKLISSLHLGHYVPQLARKIVEFNKASPYPLINLKGILVSTVEHYNILKLLLTQITCPELELLT